MFKWLKKKTEIDAELSKPYVPPPPPPPPPKVISEPVFSLCVAMLRIDEWEEKTDMADKLRILVHKTSKLEVPFSVRPYYLRNYESSRLYKCELTWVSMDERDMIEAYLEEADDLWKARWAAEKAAKAIEDRKEFMIFVEKENV